MKKSVPNAGASWSSKRAVKAVVAVGAHVAKMTKKDYSFEEQVVLAKFLRHESIFTIIDCKIAAWWNRKGVDKYFKDNNLCGDYLKFKETK